MEAIRPRPKTLECPGPADGWWEERDAFVRRLYESYGDCLLNYVGRLVPNDPHSAEDIVQETFLRAWFHSATLAPQQTSPRPWLFTVARNLVIDSVRRKHARPYEVSAEEMADLPDEEGLDNALLGHMLADALAQLLPAHREVLLHVHYLGRSGPEAAALLGVPPGTVKSRMHKAVRAMRRVLHERGISGVAGL
ncbi:sigma-70 family RNA polymerase sigma factor [Kitasatospora sp. NPDC059571]|uniref:sigma-70 family RNA polymerase sigma factor n=1 Tax=Kitasatospora sp. NPDC059571 TaxID=3346871 RepID=UPI0036921273